MLAIGSLLVIVLTSLLITRIATAALVSTGMSREYARFQSRSAFTGVGFTTNEAESVVSHPVRRRVVMVLMLVGNAGIASVVAGILLSFQGARASEATQRIVLLIGGLAVIFMLANNPRVDRLLRRVLARTLNRITDLELRDYARLLRISDQYVVDELAANEKDWLCGRTLRELDLRGEGVLVLGVDRNGSFHGTPGSETTVAAGDVLVLYGRQDVISDLDERRSGMAGELAHTDRAAEHARIRRDEETRHEEKRPDSGGSVPASTAER